MSDEKDEYSPPPFNQKAAHLQSHEDNRTSFEKNLEAPLTSNYLKYSMVFTGTNWAYYKIWLVNLILSLLSFGIYSAWAKVRKSKYLYSNTTLAGESFDYHASPIRILKGRALITILYGGFVVLGKFSPYWSLAGGLLAFSLIPWLNVRALIFKLNNTSYRKLRFGFEKSYSASYSSFIKIFFMNLATLGLGFSWSINKYISFVANHTKYGKSRFKYIGKSKPIFIASIKSALLVILSTIALSLVSSILNSSIDPTNFSSIGAIPLIYLVGLTGFSLFRKTVFNNTLNHLKIESISFRGKATTKGFFNLYFGNALIVILSLGLLYPLTTLRNHRFKIANTRIRFLKNKDLDSFVRNSTDTRGAFAEATDDFWDMDIGF